MTDKEIGYLAGIIDADGCIGSQKNSAARTYRPYLVVVQKNPAIIEWLNESFGGSVLMVSRIHKNKKHYYLRWMAVNKRATDILKLCLDCLVEKRQQAELAIQMVDICGCGKYRGKRMPDEIIENQKILFQAIKNLNSPATTERVSSLQKEMRQSELVEMKNRQRENRSIFSAQ